MTILGMVGAWQIIIIVAILIVLPLMLIALIDVLRNEFTGSNKLIWVLLILLLPVLGPLLYVLIGIKQKVKK